MIKIYSILTMLCIAISLTYGQEEVTVPIPESHGPIGVMGDHFHKKGALMFSYRFMSMYMKDNLKGTDKLRPETIVTTIKNRFFGNPGMPPTLRVVPIDMNMNMHMFGMMYAPSDKITLMAMGMLIYNKMDHRTFKGGKGTAQLGTFKTKTSGLGDTRLSAMIRLFQKETTRMHVNLGVSIPTGSVTTRAHILTPMNRRPEVRTPYPMQLGSGSWGFLPGITYAGNKEKLGWGAQLAANIRLNKNDKGYKLGNRLVFSNWLGYRLAPWVSSSIRLTALTQGKIDGIDARIMAPVQTANPDMQGGKRIDVALGLNFIGTKGFLRNQRFAVEFALPVFNDLNGPQLRTQSILTLGWQHAFNL